MPNPKQAVKLPEPFADTIQDCGTLDSVLPVLLTADSLECQAIQNVSAYCGCAVPSQACNLCSQGTVLSPEAFDNIVNFAPIPSEILVSTCGIAQAYLHSIDQKHEDCARYQQELSVQGCGCVEGTTEISNDPNTDIGDENAPADNPCGICWDGSTIGTPEKPIGYLLESILPFEMLEGTEVEALTCADAVILLSNVLEASSTECPDVRTMFAGICGCPSTVIKSCRVCADVPEIPDPERFVYTVQDYGFPPMMCQDIQLFMTQYEVSDRLCIGALDYEYLCDCDDRKKSSFREQQSWIVRLSGSLSFLGSSYIISDVYKRFRKGDWAIFHQLIGIISIFDLFSSLAFILSILPVYEYNSYGEWVGLVGPKGTEATCKMQGFMIQLGATGAFSDTFTSRTCRRRVSFWVALYRSTLPDFVVDVLCLGYKQGHVRLEN